MRINSFNKQIIICFIFLLIFTMTNFSKAEEGIDPECETYSDVCNGNLPPPPTSALRAKREAIDSNLKAVRPYSWQVRAMYVQDGELYIFDKKGNIIIGAGQSEDKGYLVEFYQKQTNRSLWRGNSKVYYWYRPESSDSDIDMIVGANRVFTLSQGRVCPNNKISELYSFYITNNEELYLDGNCAKAIKKKIGKYSFWTYPAVEKGAIPVYWTVQYFTDPITPIYDTSGECVYYCDTKEKE